MGYSRSHNGSSCLLRALVRVMQGGGCRLELLLLKVVHKEPLRRGRVSDAAVRHLGGQLQKGALVTPQLCGGGGDGGGEEGVSASGSWWCGSRLPRGTAAGKHSSKHTAGKQQASCRLHRCSRAAWAARLTREWHQPLQPQLATDRPQVYQTYGAAARLGLRLVDRIDHRLQGVGWARG